MPPPFRRSRLSPLRSNSKTFFLQGRHYGELTRAKEARFPPPRRLAARLDRAPTLAQSGAFGPAPIAGRVMSFPTELRYRLEYAGFRVIQAGVSARPLEAASRETGIAWRLIAPRLHRHKRALDNLALAFPEMPLKERERMAGDMWENLGRTFAEGFFLKQIMAEGRVPSSRWSNCAKSPAAALASSAASISATGSSSRYAGKLMGAPGHRRLSAFEQPLRRRRDAQIATADVRGGAGAEEPGHRADASQEADKAAIRRSSPTCATIAARPFLSSACRRARPCSRPCSPARPAFRSTPGPRSAAPMSISSFGATRIPVPETNDREADAIVATAALQKQFEAFIREAPEQWMWAHRKWDEGRGGRYSEIFGMISADE